MNAVNPRYVSAVEMGVTRGARNHILLSNGKRVQVSRAYATRVLDYFQDKLDRVASIPWKTAKSKPKRRARK